MQTRIAFNSGEFSPEMDCRSDLEQYGRGCSILENWQVSQMGGIKRRRGMRYVNDAISSDSRLIPYIYSYSAEEGNRFLVEVNENIIRVLGLDGTERASFSSGQNDLRFKFIQGRFRYYQQNKLLIITSIDNAPLALEFDGVADWTLKRWEFKHLPWRHFNETRDWSISINKTGSELSVEFPEEIPDEELVESMKDRDYLRVSFWLEQKEVLSKMQDILQIHTASDEEQIGVNIVTAIPETAQVGEVYAVRSEEVIKYWVCTANEGWATSNYVEGLESPANYSGAFTAAEDIAGYEDIEAHYSIKDVTSGSKIEKGTKLAIKSCYWEYYTCIKEFSREAGEATKFSDYPGYFIRGVAVGDAIPCRGKWSFYCSGVWFGSYEVRRNYETDSIYNEDWEDRGVSFSRNEAASNTSISGTEEDEECFLRLFLTRSRCMSDDNLKAGFPPDGSSNRLIVEGYKHDTVLKAIPVIDDSGNVTNVIWSCDDLVQLDWNMYRSSKDWSWSAFSGRNGYPLHCSVFQQRLVFASTKAQPLTVWFSRIDDINNFMVGDVDDAAMALTLSAPSQDPICWVQAQDDRLMLGTSTTEYTIGSSSQNLAFSATSARARAHSHVGSSEIEAIAVINKAVFVERGSSRVHEYGWNAESAGYIPRELSVFAPHIGAEHGGFVHPTLMTKPDVVLVWTLGDGQLALCTYNTMQEVKAWHRWITDGTILSACAMPDGQHEDRLYLVVKRQRKAENGAVSDESVNIEVVDKESDFVDSDTRDYTSTIITNPLVSVVQERVQKRNDNGFLLRFGKDFRYVTRDCIEVSVDGGDVWRYPDWETHSKSGWVEARADATWHFEKQVGIRVRGDQGCHILGLQG